jgi:hypothetical protein
MGNALFPECANIASRRECSQFVERMLEELNINPEQVVNMTLETYIDSLVAYAIAIQSVYRNAGMEFSDEPTWKWLAQIMAVATVYA